MSSVYFEHYVFFLHASFDHPCVRHLWRKLLEIHQHEGLDLDRPPDNVFFDADSVYSMYKEDDVLLSPNFYWYSFHLFQSLSGFVYLAQRSESVSFPCMSLDSHCKTADWSMILQRSQIKIMIILHMSYVLQATHGTDSSSRPSWSNWHSRAGESSCQLVYEHKIEKLNRKRSTMEGLWLKLVLRVWGVSFVLIHILVMKQEMWLWHFTPQQTRSRGLKELS